jgi:hypothetical protein
LPLAPHSEGCEFSSWIDKYRGIVEEALFDRVGRPTFFAAAAAAAVEMVMGRVAEKIEDEQHTAKAA